MMTKEQMKDEFEYKMSKAKLNYMYYTRKARGIAKSAMKFTMEHPVEVATGVTTAVTLGLKVSNKIGAAIENHKQTHSIYCNDVQSRVWLKRPLTLNDCTELRSRMNSGQTKFEALKSMGLLK